MLEGLDKLLTFLSKNFAFLEYLELQDNPLAVEPHYRLRVIKALPSVRLLDQQMITIIEREKASKLDFSSVNIKAKPKAKKKKNVLPDPYKGFSKIEKELYKEVNSINKTYKEQEILEETKKETHFVYVDPNTVPPTAARVLENKKKFGQDVEDQVTEWEKNTIKRLFKIYDVDKSGFLSIDELKKLMYDLINDKGIMGKVPKMNEDDVEHIFDNWDKNKDGKISWQEFRNGLNSWEWRLMDKDQMQDRIDEYFEEANRKKVQGDMKGAMQLSYKALQLQGCDTKTKPIEPPKPAADPEVKRGDVLTLRMFKTKKEIKVQSIKSK